MCVKEEREEKSENECANRRWEGRTRQKKVGGCVWRLEQEGGRRGKRPTM